MNIDSRGGPGYIDTWWYIFVPPGGTLLLRRLQVADKLGRVVKSVQAKAFKLGLKKN